MSKEKENPQVARFCVYCGTTIQNNTAYCPNPKCGKLVINIKPSEDNLDQAKPITKLIKKEQISRKCSNCSSIITSNILEQCPICDSRLEKIFQSKKKNSKIDKDMYLKIKN